MRIIAVAGLLLGCLACGKGDPPCVGEINGTYLVTITARSGNCGDSQAIVRAGDTDGGRCVDRSIRSRDGCSVELNETCTTADGMMSSRIVGTLSQVDGANRIEGVVDITLRDDDTGQSCHSVSDITYERQ